MKSNGMMVGGTGDATGQSIHRNVFSTFLLHKCQSVPVSGAPSCRLLPKLRLFLSRISSELEEQPDAKRVRDETNDAVGGEEDEPGDGLREMPVASAEAKQHSQRRNENSELKGRATEREEKVATEEQEE